MLTYIQNSDSKNAVDDATKEMDTYVSRVKNLPEVSGISCCEGRCSEQSPDDISRICWESYGVC